MIFSSLWVARGVTTLLHVLANADMTHPALCCLIPRAYTTGTKTGSASLRDCRGNFTWAKQRAFLSAPEGKGVERPRRSIGIG